MYQLYTFLFLILITLPAHATRYALVIGNEKYAHFGSLHNPRADAEDVATALQTAAFGFQVTKLLDANLRTMQTAIENFIQQLRQTDEALVYYSGHGLQYRGGNYLVPIDAQPKTGADVPYAMVNAQQLLDNLQEVNGKGVNLLILDACRNSPFKSITKSTAVGLANMQPVGSLVLYAAAPGNTALGNENLRNSIYTHYLLKALRDPTVYSSSIFDVQTRIAAAVSNDTQGAQLPWQEGSLTQTFCLVQPCGGGLASPPSVAMVTQPQPMQLTVRSNIRNGQDQVFIDGESCGSTKIVVNLEPGIHNLRVIADGYKPWEKEVELTQPYAVYAKLDEEVVPVESAAPVEPIETVAPPIAPVAVTENLISDRYRDNGDGTVTDITTNLMWKRCSEGQTWTGSTCAGYASAMTWNEAMPNGNQKSWDTFAGYADWRVPTREELKTLVYCSSGKPKTWNNIINENGDDGCNGEYQRPTIERTAFPNTPADRLADWFWTASQYAAYSSSSWIVDFYDGNVDGYYREGGGAVRLVRVGQ